MKNMDNVSYYQFQKELDYPVFVKFENPEFEINFSELLQSLGFHKVDNNELGTISIDKSSTKVLLIKEAGPRIAKQINQSHVGLESYGPESISPYGNYDVYRYRNVGLMVIGHGNYYWEMGVRNCTDHMEEVKVMLTRYISFALASQGVVGFWGVPVQEGLVIMKPKEANFESVFIDVDKGVFITTDGVKPIGADVQLLRLDHTIKGESRRMKKEELVSFLCHNTTYFSYHGLEYKLKHSIFEIVDFAEGHIYPFENFQPRSNLQLP
jgi:hypothetical protein